jgi:hypothetical protein
MLCMRLCVYVLLGLRRGVMPRGVVWCGVVWCGVVWCGMTGLWLYLFTYRPSLLTLTAF